MVAEFKGTVFKLQALFLGSRKTPATERPSVPTFMTLTVQGLQERRQKQATGRRRTQQGEAPLRPGDSIWPCSHPRPHKRDSVSRAQRLSWEPGLPRPAAHMAWPLLTALLGWFQVRPHLLCRDASYGAAGTCLDLPDAPSQAGRRPTDHTAQYGPMPAERYK